MKVDRAGGQALSDFSARAAAKESGLENMSCYKV